MENPSGDIIVDLCDETPQSPSVAFLIENVANVELGDHPLRLTSSLDALPHLPPLPDGSCLRNSGRLTRRTLFGGEHSLKKVSSADPDFEPSGVMRRSKSDFGTGAKLSQIRKCPESHLESPGTKRFMLCGSMDSLPLEYTSSQFQVKVTPPADELENIAPQPSSSPVKLPPLKDKAFVDKRLNLEKSVSSPTKGTLSPRGKRKPLKPLMIPTPTIKKSTSNSQLNGIMEIPHEAAPFEFGCPFGPKMPLHEPPLIGSLNHELKGGLQFIKPTVVSQLLNGEVKLNSKFLIVDCRWDYEFTGGHISPALNIFREEDMESFFFDNPPKLAFEEKVILIFHCEFSSHRAPKMCQALRNRDRQINSHQYPKLYYPELYVIEGGYKAFYEAHKSNCDPQQYITMDDPNFAAEAKKFNVLLHKKALGKPKRSMSSNCIFSLTRK